MTRRWTTLFAAAVLLATAGGASAQGVSNGDVPLVFEDWRMHFMQPPSRINETDVTIWLHPDGRMAITNPDRNARRSSLDADSSPWWEYEVYLEIALTDVYAWRSIGVRDGFFDKRPLIRINYKNAEGGISYVLLGFPADDRDDDFRFAVFESELEIATGLTNGEFGGLSAK